MKLVILSLALAAVARAQVGATVLHPEPRSVSFGAVPRGKIGGGSTHCMPEGTCSRADGRRGAEHHLPLRETAV
jgi:hypothetical protein